MTGDIRAPGHAPPAAQLPPAGWATPGQCGSPSLNRQTHSLDPVCLMDVDPSTAKHVVEYAGRVVAFCAPSCKKQFLAEPTAYLTA